MTTANQRPAADREQREGEGGGRAGHTHTHTLKVEHTLLADVEVRGAC